MTFLSIPISEIGKIVTGTTPSLENMSYFGNHEGYPFITPSDISWHFSDTVTSRYISEYGKDMMKSRLIPKDSVSVVCIGATIGKILRVKENSFTNQQLNSIIVDKSRFDPDYVFYAIKYQIEKIKAFGAGAATPLINKTDFGTILIDLHENKDEQSRIGSTLSQYDDIIECNNRCIGLIEKVIHFLYREWFIYHRIPGGVNKNSSKEVPGNWKKKTLADVVEFNPKTEIDRFSCRPFLDMNCLSINSMVIKEPVLKIPKGGAKFKNHDTLLARITPCLENGKTGYVQLFPSENESGTGSTEFIVMRGKNVPSTWVYALARSKAFRQHAVNGMTGSDGRQRTQVDFLKQFEVNIPPKEVFDNWNELVSKMFEQIDVLSQQNRLLSGTIKSRMPQLLDRRLYA